MRRSLTLSFVAAVACAAPLVSHAAPPCAYGADDSCQPPPIAIQSPDCGATLVDAVNGATNSCSTPGGSTLHGSPLARTLTLSTQTGNATATLTCYRYDGGPNVVASLTVPAPFTQSTVIDVTDTYYCYLIITSLFHDTTAIATDTTTTPNTVSRTATVTTASCASTGGLCQQNNPGQPGGNNDNPYTTITATMVFADNGTTLTGFGVGSGFVPGRSYVSLIYLNGNTQTCSRFPAGQPALTTNIANADNDFASMYLGMWNVDNLGYGSFQVFPNKPTPVGGTSLGGFAAYGTVSVREVAGGVFDGQTSAIAANIQAGKDAPPNIFALRACGALTS